MINKTALVYKTEENLKQFSENNIKLLFTTYGFKFLGIVTSDKMRPEESLGVRRRWIKGLIMENGSPLKPEDRIFETSLHRKNPKTGRLEDIVAHEDDLVIIMERKTFELSDNEDNFQFMPNMHMLNRIQQMSDEIEEGRRRLVRLEEEKEQALLDTDHFKRQAITAVEREKTQTSLINRLTREHFQLQEQIGNLESTIVRLRSKNLEYEATADEKMANAQEIGTMKGMSDSDLVIHGIQKQKEIHEAFLDIEPSGNPEMDSLYDDVDELKDEIKSLKEQMAKTGLKIEQKQAQTSTAVQSKPTG